MKLDYSSHPVRRLGDGPGRVEMLYAQRATHTNVKPKTMPLHPAFGAATTTVSGDFIWHVRFVFERAVEDPVTRQGTTTPRYTPSSFALPCYVVAAAAVEAAINEFFLTDTPKITWRVTAPESYDRQTLERLPLVKKIQTLSDLFFGKMLSPDKSPLQEMQALVDVRNELIHYKFGAKPPKAVRMMTAQGAATRVPPAQEDGGPTPWSHRVSTLQGILWAHDTACRTVRAVVAQAPDDCQPRLLPFTGNFNVHWEWKLRQHVRERGIELGDVEGRAK